jgi:hypothetical protein
LAQLVAEFLRGCGAEPDHVPTDLSDAAARNHWIEARASFAPHVRLYLIDIAAAILETNPRRKITRKGRPLGRAVAETEAFASRLGSLIEAARFVAPNYAEKLPSKGAPIDREIKKKIEADAQRLARQVSRRSKRNMPK